MSRLSLLAAPLLATVLAAALPGSDGGDADASGALTGQLIVASPEMDDPRFAETVILMVRQGKSGAFGIVINRPVEERSLASLLAEMGDKNSDAQGEIHIFAGGPVEPEAGFVIHSAEYHDAATMAIDGRIAVTSSAQILRDMGHGKGPAKSLVAFGYAGWGPGQLEAEIAHRDWFSEPEDPKLVFDVERSVLWRQALDRRSRDL